MKKLTFAIFVLCSLNASAQGYQEYTSSTRFKTLPKSGEIQVEKRKILIAEDLKTIAITSMKGWGNGLLELKINNIQEKEDTWMGRGKLIWYYCTSTEKDPIENQYTEYIVVMKARNATSLSLCQKLDEVTWIENTLSLK